MNKFLGIILFLFFTLFTYAEENYLNIDAEVFESDEKKQKLFFKGKVKLTKNKDVLTSKKLVINTRASKDNPDKQVPKDYVASGNVQFTMHTKDNKILKGKGDTVYYYPDEQRYIIEGNGYLEDTTEDKKINAAKIYVDEKTGYIKIDGEKDKPAKFRIKLEEKKDS
jgi:lipopolysaccharide export system protein LptA